MDEKSPAAKILNWPHDGHLTFQNDKETSMNQTIFTRRALGTALLAIAAAVTLAVTALLLRWLKTKGAQRFAML